METIEVKMETNDDKVCIYCQKVFKTATIRKRHERIHTDEAYQCHICSKRTAQRSHWIEHMTKVHQQLPVLDPPSPKPTTTQQSDEPNSATVSEEPQNFAYIDGKYVCNFCFKQFRTRSTIRRHERVHINPFICDYCGFKSGSKWHLRDHLMGHTRLIDPNQKLVKGRNNSIRKESSRVYCDECGKYFYSEHDLNSHKKRRHTLKIVKGTDLGRLFELFGHENEINDESPDLNFVVFSSVPDENLLTEVFVKEEPGNEEYLEQGLYNESFDGGDVGQYKCSCNETFPRFIDLAYHESTAHPESFRETVESMRGLVLKMLGVDEPQQPQNLLEITEYESKDIKTCPSPNFEHHKKPESYQDLISRSVTVECTFCRNQMPALLYEEHLKYEHPLEDPISARHDTQKYGCNCCLKIFKNLLACVNHIRAADHQLEGTTCDICTADNFSNLQELNSHRTLAHQNKSQPTCDQCQKTFTNNRLLKFHMLTHKGLKACRCKMCGGKFLSAEELERHQSVHENEATRVCPTCGLEFMGRERLRQHMKSRHGVTKGGHRGKEIMCNICGKVFHGKDRLKNHFARVHTERTFDIECPHCAKKFDTKHEVKKHMVVHTKELKYFCERCDRGFTRKQSLNRHVKIHDDSTKTFTCTFCPKTFRSASNMKRHLMSHTGEKNQLCTECDASYADRSCLNKHMERAHGRPLPGYNKGGGVYEVQGN